MRSILFISILAVIFASSAARLRAQELDSDVRAVDPSLNVRIDGQSLEPVPSDVPAKKPTTSASWAPARNSGLWHASDRPVDSQSAGAGTRPPLDPQGRVKQNPSINAADDSAKEKFQKTGQPHVSLSGRGGNDASSVGNSTTENAAAFSDPKQGTNNTFPSFNRTPVGLEDISLFPEAKALHAGITATPSRKSSANTAKSGNGRRKAVTDPRQAAK
jgi:hypothetical protein